MSGPNSLVRRFRLYERFGSRCVYCDQAADTVDHLLPRRLTKERRRPAWLPARNHEINLAPACSICNRRKGSKDIRDFLQHAPDRLARIVRTMALIDRRAMELLDPPIPKREKAPPEPEERSPGPGGAA